MFSVTAVTAEATKDPNLLATDLADRLVLGGVPFRQAHEIVGKLVALAAERGVGLHKLPDADYLAASAVLTRWWMSSAEDSVPLAYFSSRTSVEMACGASAASILGRSLSFMTNS